jgi:hypothetical protein
MQSNGYRVTPIIAFNAEYEYGIATNADAHKPTIAFFGDITMKAERITWGIEVDDRSLRSHLWEQSTKQVRNIWRKRGWRFLRIDFIRPIILAT